MQTSSTESLLTVDSLVKHYPVKGGVLKRTIAQVQAVAGVSFDLPLGETMGLVGESGCGKSTLGRLLIRLEDPTEGRILFRGEDLAFMRERTLRRQRKNFQMIFQDPFSSLNPKMTVYRLLAEPLQNFFPEMNRSQIDDRLRELMQDVGFRPEYANRYPHEFSGGQRQRVSIARALAASPSLIICDEPVSALDVSIQAQILNLLMDLQKKYGMSYVFISHDLHVVRHISHRIAVMYLGRIVEIGTNDKVYHSALHPYTQALLSAVPVARVGMNRKRIVLQGDVPSPINPPSGCAFHPRCPYTIDVCRVEVPQLRNFGSDQRVACHRAEMFQ